MSKLIKKNKNKKTQIIKNLKGVVMWYNDRQGRGMIKAKLGSVGSTDVQVKKNNILNKNRTLRPNVTVMFDCFVDEYRTNTAVKVKIIKPYLDLHYGTVMENNIKLERVIKNPKTNKKYKTVYYENNSNYCLDYINIGERVEFEVSFNNDYNEYEAFNIKRAKQPEYYGKIIELYIRNDTNNNNNNNNNNNYQDGFGWLKEIDNGNMYKFFSDDVKGFKNLYEGDYVKFNINYRRFNPTATFIKKCDKPKHLKCDNKLYYGRISMIKGGNYGFIKPENAKQDFYFHINSNVNTNDKVNFNVETNKNTGKIYAINVKKIIENKKDTNKNTDNNKNNEKNKTNKKHLEISSDDNSEIRDNDIKSDVNINVNKNINVKG